MRRQQRRTRQQSKDQNAQSRLELKQKLQYLDDDFILSRFGDSRNDNMPIVKFPENNDPTLELKDTEQSHPKLEEDISLDRDQPEGLTARLSYQDRSSTQIFLLEERVESLTKELEEKEEEVVLTKRKNEVMQKELDKTQKELERTVKELDRSKKELQRRNEKIEGLQKQLGSLRLKQSNSDYDSRNSCSNSKSLLEESLQNFCPELLSPEETVQLLNQLLRKVSKSSKMMKSLSSDAATKEIITKIHKN